MALNRRRLASPVITLGTKIAQYRRCNGNEAVDIQTTDWLTRSPPFRQSEVLDPRASRWRARSLPDCPSEIASRQAGQPGLPTFDRSPAGSPGPDLRDPGHFGREPCAVTIVAAIRALLISYVPIRRLQLPWRRILPRRSRSEPARADTHSGGKNTISAGHLWRRLGRPSSM